ncbi:MAG TPA: Calx-beta domain-containing protein [Pyrinomonadaceae bacterium]|jgi:Tol biopolymer transport system component
MGQRNTAAAGLRATLRGLPRAGALLLFAVCGWLTAAAQTTSFVELASLNAAGTQAGDRPSSRASSSADGRFVVFNSNAADLVPDDRNGPETDVFVRDLLLDTTRLVSVNAAGTGSGDKGSFGPSITPDGRYVVFRSTATDLTAVSRQQSGVYVRDLVAQTTTLASVGNSNVPLDDGFGATFITPDGRYVVFYNSFDVYRRDLLTATTALVTANTEGTGGANGISFGVQITPDGRYVVFPSKATNLVPTPTDGVTTNVFRRDLQTNTTALVSVNGAGTGGGNADSSFGVISDDGRVVAYWSAATNLVPADPGTGFTSTSVYVRDFAANTTTLVSERQVPGGSAATVPAAESPAVSADGRYVFYLRPDSPAGSVSPVRFRDRVFRRDLQTGALLELPFVPTGVCEQGPDCRSIVSGYVTSRDGRYVAYRQQEQPRESFVPVSTAIVVRDMVGGGAEVVNGLPGINSTDIRDAILTPGSVGAGGRVAFSSGVSHSPADANQHEDVYLFSPPAQTRLAFNRAGYRVGEDGSRLAAHTVLVRRAGYLIDTAATVKLNTSDGTATAGSDYVPLSLTLTFAPGETEKTVTVQIVDDAVLEPAETLNLTLGDPTGNATLGGQSSATLTIADNDLHTVQFGPDQPFGAYAFEAEGSALLTVTRTGATSQAVSVDYATSDGTASERSDYITASGRVTFAPGETTKIIEVFIVNDAYVEPQETFSVTLSNLRGANAVLGAATTKQMTILSDDGAPAAANPVDDSQFFVWQHYLDFLNREPDQDGFEFWTNEIESCGGNAACREVKRINVSAAFFLSIEFQETGYLVYRLHKAAYGNLPGKPVPVRLRDFLADTREIGQGVRVNVGDWRGQLEANKNALAASFVSRAEFAALYPESMTAAQFVDALNSNAGGALSRAERDALVNDVSDGARTRAQALRAVAEDADLARAEFDRAFVLMQYFGYLRRNPDDLPNSDFSGWQFWLSKLNEFGGDFIRAEMVKAFISSDEYRKRFGP